MIVSPCNKPYSGFHVSRVLTFVLLSAVLGISLPLHAQLPTAISSAVNGLQCAASRANSTFNCTAGEFTTLVNFGQTATTPTACVAGDMVTVGLIANLSGTNAFRYDGGIYFGQNANNPGSLGGTCAVAPFPNSSSGTGFIGTPDNDGCGNFTPGGTERWEVDNVQVMCSSSTTGTLQVPYLVTYNQNDPGTCGGATSTLLVPGSPSKCNSGMATVPGMQVQGWVKITKVTAPNATTDAFNFTASGPGGVLNTANVAPTGFTLTNGQTQRVVMNLSSAAQALTITEAALGGWDPTAAITCTDPNGNSASAYVTVDNATRTITANLSPTNFGAICQITNSRTRVRTAKALSPTTDPGLFNLSTQTDFGTASASSVGNGGATAYEPITTGSAAIAETAASGTNLANYATTVACVDDTAGGSVTPSATNLTDATTRTATVSPPLHHDVTCTFTNTRISATLTLAKSWANAHTGDVASIGATQGFTNNTSSFTANAGAAASSNTVVVYAGEAGTLPAETLSSGVLGNYNTTLTCSGGVLGGSDGQSSNALTIRPADGGAAITCTYNNARKSALFQLRKTWTNGLGGNVASIGATTGLTNNTAAFTATAPASNNSGAAVTVYAGEVATLPAETMSSGSLGSYTTALSCAGGTLSGTNGQASGNTIAINAADAGATIVCTYNNSRKSATLTLQKTWSAAANAGDQITLTASSGLGGGSALASTAQSGGNTTTGSAVTVYAGDSGTITESFGSGAASNYSASLACSGTSGLSGNTLTVGATDAAITCTQTNTRKTHTLTVVKSLNPTSDSGTFVMNANGTTGSEGGNGATASATVNAGSSVTFSEAAGAGTNLANYVSSWSCNTSPATTGSGGSGSLTMPDADVTCTITNKRRQADVTITKTNGAASVDAGGTTTYTIVVTNNGPDAADGTVVTDPAATGLQKTSVSCAASGSAVCPSSPTPAQLESGITIATLPSGGSLTFTVQANVTVSSGSVTNTATVSIPPTVVDPTPGNNSASDTDTVNAVADLAITKSATPSGTYTPGSAITYTIVVTNNGPSFANSFNITDAVPSGIGGVSVSCAAAGSGNNCGTNASSGNGIAFNGAALNAGAGNSITLTVTGTIAANASGSLTNTASVAPGAGAAFIDPSSGNNSASVVNAASASADVQITKTGPASAVAGTNVSYTLAVKNNGPSDAQAVAINDTTPSGLTFVSATAPCAGGVAPCSLGTVGAGQTVTITVVYAVPSSYSGGTITNTATVSGSTPDPTPGNNSSTVSTPVDRNADLAISKTNNSASVNAGGTTTYTIVVTNNGPSDANGATVTDPAAGGLSKTSVTCAASGSAVCPSSPTPAQLESGIVIPTLPNGGSVTFTVQASVTAASGSVTNTATVAPPSGVTDPTPGNDAASDTDSVSPVSDLAIFKSDGQSSAVPGSAVTYTITVTNAGPSAAAGAAVTDTMPAALTGVTWTCSASTGGTCAANGSGNINDTVTVPANGTLTYTVHATISATATGPLANTASVTPPAGTNDPAPGNNSSTDTDSLTPQADLAITKSDGAATYTPGGPIAYTIVVTNNGPSAANSIDVTDVVPAAIGGVSVTCVAAGAGNSCGANATSGNNVAFTGASLNPGAGNSLTITVGGTVASNATGNLSNTASVAPGNGANFSDPGSGNDSATDTDTPSASADLQITKTGPASINSGTNVVYTIAVKNNGPSDAQSVSVADSTPAGLTFVSATAPCSGGFPCSLGTVTSGQIATFTVTYAVPANYNGASISNTASVSSATSDPTSGNNSSTATTQVTESDMTAAFSSVPSEMSPGQNLTGLTLTCTNSGSSAAANAACVPSVNTNDGIGTGITNVACNPTVPASIAAGASITCTFDYTVPGTAGGSDDATTTVTFTGTTSATNDANTGNNTATAQSNVVDAVDDAAGAPGGTVGATHNLAANDQYPTNSTFTLVGGGTCANASVSTAGMATYDLPASGSCTVQYQVCAPSPNQSVCDTATLTVTATASDMAAAFGSIPSEVSPGQTLTGLSLTCTNIGVSTATNAICAPSANTNDGITTGIINVVCVPAAPASVASNGTIACTFDYAVPGTAGGSDDATTTVTFTGTTGATNDANTGNNAATAQATVIDAVDDAAGAPGGTVGATYNVASNDQYPTGSTFSLVGGGTCANAGVSSTGAATYDVPASGSCTVQYQVCAPSPNPSVCDTATLTVTATASDMAAAFGPIPTQVSPGQNLTGLTLTCTNTGATTATNATCAPSVNTNDGIATGIANVACTPSTPTNVAAGASITCTFDYAVPGTAGGSDDATTTVTFTGTTGATNDANTGNDTATMQSNVVDAVDDAAGAPGGTVGATYNVAANDQYPTNSTFAIVSGGTCANASMSSAGTATYDVPASGSCTVQYQVCAPSPNPGVCDTATLTVTASASDMTAAFGSVPSEAGPGQSLTGLTLTCTNTGATTATNATCVPSANTNDGISTGLTNVACNPTVPASVAAGASITCTFDYTVPGTAGGSDDATTIVTFAGTTSATNDANTGNNTATAPSNVIDALDDTLGSGSVSGGTTASVLDNDSVGAAAATMGNATLTTNGAPSCTPAAPGATCSTLTLNADGTVTVPANATPGTYQVPYQICSKAAGTACDHAVASVVVSDTAQADMAGSGTSVNGTVGTPVTVTTTCINNGPQTAANATCSVTGAPPGATTTCNPPLPVSALAAGSTIVCTTTWTPTAPGAVTLTTTGGSSTTDPNAANNTATTPVTVVSAAINPVPDSGTVQAGTGGTAVANVATNDTINGQPAMLGPSGNATVTPTGTWPPGIALDPATGAVSVAGSVASGTYTVNYVLCDRAAPANCAPTAVTINVTSVATDLQAIGAATQTVPVNTPVTVVTTCVNGGPLAAANATCAVTGIPASAAAVPVAKSATGGAGSGGPVMTAAAAATGTTCTPVAPVANFAVGAVITCTTRFTPTQPGTYVLPTTASSDAPDSNPANDTAPSTVIVVATQPSQSSDVVPVPVGSRWMLALLGLLFAAGAMRALRMSRRPPVRS